jgi:hypothetical protein
LNLRRSVLKVQGDGSEGAAQRKGEILPLDDYLRITGLPFKMSPEMMAETAFFGLHESSFASAEQMMRKHLPTRISDRGSGPIGRGKKQRFPRGHEGAEPRVFPVGSGDTQAAVPSRI